MNQHLLVKMCQFGVGQKGKIKAINNHLRLDLAHFPCAAE
jgi:hypothetical protein